MMNSTDTKETRKQQQAETERARKRRVLSLLVSDAAKGARRYVTEFRAGRGAE